MMNQEAFQSASGFSRTLASLKCFSLSASSCLSAAETSGCVASLRDVWVSSFKVGRRLRPSPLLLSSKHKSHRNGCAASKSVAAQQAKRADVFCVRAVDQKPGVAHNHLQSLSWDRVCVCVYAERMTTESFTLNKEQYKSKGPSVHQFHVDV